MNANSRVPMNRLGPIIDEWLAQPGNTLANLSALSGVPTRRIYSIRRGYDFTRRGDKKFRHVNVEFTTADNLLIAMDKIDEWWNRLADIYDAA